MTEKTLKRVKVDGGQPCPKCKKQMQRYEHPPRWEPKPGKCFYRYWDKCLRCRHLQHYPAAFVPSQKFIEWDEHRRGGPDLGVLMGERIA